MPNLAAGFLILVAIPASVSADVWDVPPFGDNSATSRNELVHGSDQVHDMAIQPGPTLDEDWYRISQKGYASYEVVVDSTSSRIGGQVIIERVSSSGTVLQSATPVGVGYSQSMTWRNTSASAVSTENIKVRLVTGTCAPTCGAEDVYRIRLFETTYAVPRFNNTNGQFTVFQLQNPTSYPVSGTVFFWNAGGSLVASHPFALPPRQMVSLNTATVSGASSESGSVTVAHDARYGDLAGKAVGIEPATGFTFDTAMSYRPR